MSQEGITIRRVCVCGMQTTLGRALQNALSAIGCEVVEISASDLRIPPSSLAEKIQGADGIVNLFGEPYVASGQAGTNSTYIEQTRRHPSYRTGYSLLQS